MDELKKLLEATERPRDLTGDEDRRIRARLGLDVAGDADAQPSADDAASDESVRFEIQDIGVAQSTRRERRLILSAVPYMASAAALLLLVLVIGTRIDTGDNVVVTDDVAEPTTIVTAVPTVDPSTLALRQTCARYLTPLVADIVAWGGIDLWGVVNLDTATPNLESSLLDALEGFGELPLTASAVDVADWLRAEIGAAKELGTQNQLLEKPARVDAVKTAAGGLASLLAAQGVGAVCDVGELDDALALG